MTLNLQGSLFGDLARARINIASDSFRLILLGTAYTWSWSHNRRDDLTGEIAAGGGYTTGGVAVTLTDSVDAVAQQAIIHVGAVGISPGPITGARWGAIVKWGGGSAADDPLIAVYDWGQVLTAGPLAIPATTITLNR
jgi:hypothetical protein